MKAKNVKLTLTPAEAYITHRVLQEGFYTAYERMRLEEIDGSRSIITREYVRQIIEPILKQLEQK